MNSKVKAIFEQFEHAPNSALVSLSSSSIIAARSRASLYRDNKVGLLPFVKVGSSTRVRVGDLRKLIGAAREQVAA